LAGLHSRLCSLKGKRREPDRPNDADGGHPNSNEGDLFLPQPADGHPLSPYGAASRATALQPRTRTKDGGGPRPPAVEGPRAEAGAGPRTEAKGDRRVQPLKKSDLVPPLEVSVAASTEAALPPSRRRTVGGQGQHPVLERRRPGLAWGVQEWKWPSNTWEVE
jgi:hypothetical protein